jgi:hypothetical protein
MNKSVSRKEVIELCDQYRIKKYTISKDVDGYYIDVYGDVRLNSFGVSSIPIRFGYVSGGFYCYNNSLTSLKGCPNKVGGVFDCDNNLLTSLEGCPINVGGNFYCHGNYLGDNSYYHLFDIGYTDAKILTGDDLVSIKRQWVLKSIIND